MLLTPFLPYNVNVTIFENLLLKTMHLILDRSHLKFSLKLSNLSLVLSNA